ncbi:DNA cytosine methyltransferase [Clostridium sp.]
MRILVACEYSGTVRNAFRKLGHDAWSCDILPTDSHPEYHYQRDITELLKEKWDMIIAFPPCTHLAVSGARHFKEKIADGRQQQGIDFFMLFTNLNCPRVAIENPIGIMSSKYKKPNQIIQPWMFGHTERKATCLWLKGLPILMPTNDVKEEMLKLPENVQQRIHYLPPSANRARLRSKTFPGIAAAMANQWTK